ncbi:MAG: primosomal protein N' [Burkholderiaceae bacterium]|jgi:primosomal protein N' (replication factor Y)|nr:primosomal protein N' [Burkholderiaceae bacterium]
MGSLTASSDPPVQPSLWPWRLQIAVHTPAHSALGDLLDYVAQEALPAGTLVRVPLGRNEVLGVVWGCQAVPECGPDVAQGIDASALKPIIAPLEGLTPLSAAWRDLIAFSARYYRHALGEVALSALPPQLRKLSAAQLQRRFNRSAHRSEKRRADRDPAPPPAAPAQPAAVRVQLSAQQADALERFEREDGPFLLFGATGSGKTEVYLRAVERLLERDAQAQALVMVPEINLTPQLEARFQERFGADAVVSQHSGMTDPQRLRSWLAAHSGQARIVLGTRLAVFASMPRLALIVVDEEHDPSYKQQDGARYSARDLAIWRARREGAKVLLGSATPSLESWHNSRPPSTLGALDPGGRYRRLPMPERVAEAAWPALRLIDMNQQPAHTLIAPALLQAIQACIGRGEQSMALLNRRGYAPVLACADCNWKSECPHCSAYRVFHKVDRTLRCHHCGYTERVPRACPQCGNPDIAPLGRGTERIEEHLAQLLAPLQRPGGGAVRIARIDADTTRRQGALQSQLASVHAGEVDVLIGTQMIAKGHDFRRITLVAALNLDGALYSSDFRASERLFALLMQAAGRAGRDAAWLAEQGSRAQMVIQTHHPQHRLFAALRAHDYPAFAQDQLEERRAAGMPPFTFQALLCAHARTQEAAQGFLQAVGDATQALPAAARVTRYPAVPMMIQRIANIERAQMLVESPSRAALQAWLAQCQPLLHALRRAPAGKGVIRWLIDVDPQAI